MPTEYIRRDTVLAVLAPMFPALTLDEIERLPTVIIQDGGIPNAKGDAPD